MISFECIELDKITFEDMNLIGEVNVFQTSNWLNYLSDVQNAKPIVAAVKSDSRLLGYFTGLVSNLFGLKILGSPPKGPLTYFMGFNLLPGAPKREILQALPRFAFEDLGCHYLEVIDPNLQPGDCEGLSYKVEHRQFFAINLSPSEEELFANMDNTGRNCIRQSIKKGVAIEEASDIGFADEYYSQYVEVLSKYSISPNYSLSSVRKLIEFNLPTGNLLLLRAKNREGQCVATGIFLALNKTAVFWGAASWRAYQNLRPNEPIAWYGMKTMKAWGTQELHLGEKNEHFKIKMGAREIQLCRLMKTKYRSLGLFVYPLMSPKNEKFRKFRNLILKRIGFYKD